MAIYECRTCRHEQGVPRRYNYHFGKICRCPKCGTTRLKKLKDRDPIDPMVPGFLNMLELIAGGTLHHCCFCRIQFYDRRPLLSQTTPAANIEPEDENLSEEKLMSPPDKASSGA